MTEQSNPSSADSLLAMLAFQLREDPDYMASVLFRFQMFESMDGLLLADLLSISAQQLNCLALCKRPQSSDQSFADQVRQIATYSGADPGRVASIIRRVDALAAVQDIPLANEVGAQRSTAGLSSVGWLAAARDRNTEENKAAEDENDDAEGTE